MALAALPKCFGMEEIKTAYFPHLLNNLNYTGPYPDTAFYGAAQMKTKAKDKFYEWYNEQAAYTSFFGNYRLLSFTDCSQQDFQFQVIINILQF